jgi:heavy metal sensor kinase
VTARLPIRWRITLWYAGMLLATLALFGVGLYVGLRTLLYDSFQEQARQQAELVTSSLDLSSDRPVIDPATLEDFSDEERFLRVTAADGSIIADTSPKVGIPAGALGTIDPGSNGESFRFIDSGSGNYGVVSTRVEANGGAVGVVQVGISREDVDEALKAVTLVFTIGAPLVLAAAILGGYIVSRRTLSPVVTITEMASALQADELGARLNLALPDDELGRLARTFDAMLARIEAAFTRQRQFTGDAAHELRTPLSLMRSQVDFALSRDRTDEEYRDALQSLGGDIERLTSLVTTLLTLARADTGRLRVERELVDLADVVSPLLDAYAPQAEEAGIALIDESSPARVIADEDLVVQVLVNLVDNALAHTPRGGRVSIGCGIRDGQACLWVADTGVGIAPEHQAQIFERFYRVDTGRTRAHGGTGLGLAFCKAIAEAHGGSIRLISNSGQGARFILCLPTG